ncbi:MAG: LuxR C-terminal-related transcriptional regulator [Firmicutes bacterium]|nr:LuxR C-terminal-related transcriptional regulator [Bacillota bacterium]
MVSIEFEMLSISYIISELFLLSVHLVIQENQQLKEHAKQPEQAVPSCGVQPEHSAPADADGDDAETLLNALADLTPKERALFDAYMAGESTKGIMAAMNITENTLKFHSRNLYGKLGVTSRKQLESRYRSISAPNREN